MRIGVPKEIKDKEERVALLPDAVAALRRKGHRVLVQAGAGQGAGYEDADYRRAGAAIVARARELYAKSELVVKVKEPLPAEYGFFRPGLQMFCYLHLAANRRLTTALMRGGVIALAFETLVDGAGGTPLLKPMSEIAGRLAVTLGTHFLYRIRGGRGVLLAPTHFSPPGKVTVLGAGSVGRSAAELAAGMGAEVTVLDIRAQALASWARGVKGVSLHPYRSGLLAAQMRRSDLVVGAVYVHGAKTPQLIRKEMVKAMPKGSVLMDVAVDQGGASETTRPTSLSRPVYSRYGVVHCAVTNMPALVSRTASQALSGAILPYVIRVASRADLSALLKDPKLSGALNVAGGKVIHPAVRVSLNF